jgi:hypothetical protein
MQPYSSLAEPRAAPSFENYIPVRTFIGISDADGDATLDVVEQYLKDQIT